MKKTRFAFATVLSMGLAAALAACGASSESTSQARTETTGPGEATATTATKEPTVKIFETPIHELGGAETTLSKHQGKALLIVNVASKCGLTPQYAGLEKLYETYKDRGLVVLGFPCNQFGAQEPGSADEIQSFCEVNYGVTFPLYEKVEVNGEGRHPIYAELTQFPDQGGESGDIQWNFEKFVVSADGSTVTRFRPKTTPDDPALIRAIEEALPR